MPQRPLQAILTEAEAAGRNGEEFSRWWLAAVCRRQNRVRFITQDVCDQAEEAWKKGRGDRG